MIFEKISKKITNLIFYFDAYFRLHYSTIRNFSNFKLLINFAEKGGRLYFDKKYDLEVNSILLKNIFKYYPPNLVIDIGANYGFTSCLFFKLSKNAKIVAVEPSKIMCEYLKNNIELNQVKDITVIQKACSISDKKKFLYKDIGLSSQASTVREINKNSKNDNNIESITLEKIIKKYSDIRTRNIFIKIDTQGYEADILRGSINILKKTNNWIMKLEFYPYGLEQNNIDPYEFLNFLINNFYIYQWDDCCFNIEEKCLKNINEFYKINFKSKKSWVDLLILPIIKEKLFLKKSEYKK